MSFSKAFSTGERARPKARDALGGFLSGGWVGSWPVLCSCRCRSPLPWSVCHDWMAFGQLPGQESPCGGSFDGWFTVSCWSAQALPVWWLVLAAVRVPGWTHCPGNNQGAFTASCPRMRQPRPQRNSVRREGKVSQPGLLGCGEEEMLSVCDMLGILLAE